MLTRLSAAIVGLLAFAGCIIVGLLANNPFETTLLRALGGLAGGMLLGLAVGWLAQRLVEEQFRKMVSADIAEEMRQAAQAKAGADDETDGTREPRADRTPGGTVRHEADGAEPTIPAASVSDEDETLASRAARELMGDFDAPVEVAEIGAGAGETAVRG